MIELNSSEVGIFFTSDTHFYHKNITRGVSKWDVGRGARDFNTIEEMTTSIIDSINKHAKEDDILFHLGDWSFGGIDKIWEARERIICKNIYMIGGNHDLHIIQNKTLPNCYNDDVRVQTGHTDYFYSVSAQELFNYRGLADLVKIDKTLIYLSHFPSEGVRFDRKFIHLHGHTHGSINDANREFDKERLDVGIDSAFEIFGEYRPFSWNEICKLLKQ